MTVRKSAGHDYADRSVANWNVNHYLAWLGAETKARFNVDYQPGGIGRITAKWSMERGMLKRAQEAVGNAVLKRFIERCLDRYKPNGQYLYATFTFMWSYMRDELPRAQSDVAQANAVSERRGVAVEVDSLDDLI